MRSVTVREAEENVPLILDWEEAGEEVVITRDGKPVATLGPYQATRTGTGAAEADPPPSPPVRR